VTLDIIYTPWRYQYVSNVDNKGDGCVFCDKAAASDDRKSLILKRGVHCFVMLNLYPYTSGHLMVAPYKHTGTIEDLTPEALSEMMALVVESMQAIRDAFGPDGFNVGINMSRVAGAGIKDHVHTHVVPRWAGDSNFMPITADTRVLPCDLETVYDRVLEKFK
jgi:ATP adenylyltransferase